MPPIERFDLVDRAVYWKKTGDDRYGRPVLAAPTEVGVRVVMKRRDVLDPAGNVVSVDGTVAFGFVPADGSLMWHGLLTGLSSGVPPANVLQIVRTATAPDVNGRVVRYEGSVVRYREDFPAGSVTG